MLKSFQPLCGGSIPEGNMSVVRKMTATRKMDKRVEAIP